jgi:hypothetical protein
MFEDTIQIVIGDGLWGNDAPGEALFTNSPTNHVRPGSTGGFYLAVAGRDNLIHQRLVEDLGIFQPLGHIASDFRHLFTHIWFQLTELGLSRLPTRDEVQHADRPADW